MLKRMAAAGLFLVMAGGGTSFSPPSTLVADQQTQGQVAIPYVRPDMVLEKIWTEETAAGAGQRRVEIRYTIFNNSSVSSSCCPTAEGKKAWQENPIMNLFFICSVEARAYPDGRFAKLPDHDGGVFTTLLKPSERQTLWGHEIVPEGKRREYRVRIDPPNWINEKNEDNNQATKMWPATRTK